MAVRQITRRGRATVVVSVTELVLQSRRGPLEMGNVDKGGEKSDGEQRTKASKRQKKERQKEARFSETFSDLSRHAGLDEWAERETRDLHVFLA